MLSVLRCPACELLVAVDETDLSIAACPRCEGHLEKNDASPGENSDDDATAD